MCMCVSGKVQRRLDDDAAAAVVGTLFTGDVVIVFGWWRREVFVLENIRKMGRIDEDRIYSFG